MTVAWRRSRTPDSGSPALDPINKSAGGVMQSASILVVDDTLVYLRLLSKLLADRGYPVRTAMSGEQALQAARIAPPDLILLDITMPDMDGFQVCAQLKAEAALREIPVIFLTSLSETADKLHAFKSGAADYITKPFQVDEVLARVKVHLALRSARKELSRQYEHLLALERLRDDRVHMVVHDMRSPLMILLMHLDMIKKAVAALGEETQEDVRVALKAAFGLSRMSHDLLDVSRLEEGKLPLDREEIDLAEVARNVVKELGDLDRDRPMEVDASGVITAWCDRGIIQRVLENLVGNAIRHTPAGGRIQVRVYAGADGVRVSVTDQGPGVPLALRRLIFEKFGAVAARKDQEIRSTGLGLAFCKLAIEAHDGRIGVDGNDPLGSIFWFDLPA